MKKIIYSSMFCLVLVASYSVLVGFGEDDVASLMNHPSEDEMSQLDPIDTDNQKDIEFSDDMSDEPEALESDSKQNSDSEVSDDAGQDEDAVTNDAKLGENTEPESKVNVPTDGFKQGMNPVLSHQWVDSTEKNDKVSEETSEHVSTKSDDMPKLTTSDLQGSVEMHEKIAENYKELADNIQKVWAALQGSELGKSVNIVELTQLLHNAQNAHKNAGSVFEVMLTIQKLGYQLGDKLESELQAKAAELSKKAQEASQKATEEMESSLGLKQAMKS